MRSRGDWAAWAWSVTGNEAGTYTLVLGLTVLKEDTNEAISPTRYYPLTITVTVKRTPGSIIKAVGSGVTSVLGWLTAVVTTLGALGVVGLSKRVITRFKSQRRHDDRGDRG